MNVFFPKNEGRISIDSTLVLNIILNTEQFKNSNSHFCSIKIQKLEILKAKNEDLLKKQKSKQL